MRVFSAFAAVVSATSIGNWIVQARIQADGLKASEQMRVECILVAQLMVEFKWLVQSWKDILLRGSDPSDLAKYQADLQTFHLSIGHMAQHLRESLPPDEAVLVDEFSQGEKQLLEAYSEALDLATKSPTFDYRAADRAVRGKDRRALDPLSFLINKINADSDHQLAENYAAVQRIQAICLSMILVLVIAMWWLIRGFFRKRRVIEEAQAQHHAQLETLGKMLAGTIHEIRNHVAVIDGRARQIEHALGSDPIPADKARQNCRALVRVNQRTEHVVSTITRFSKRAAATDLKPTSVAEIVADAVLITQHKIQEYAATIRVSLPDPDVFVDAVGVEICQVLINLLSNGADAVQLLPEKWVQLDVTVDGAWVAFSVTDSGPGIPRATLEKMDRSFFTTKQAGKGTGQGLNISRAIIARHLGRMAYDDTGTNTRFIFWLRRIVNEEMRQAV